MKVMLVNGSPHEHGCTDAALREVASALNADGIDTEIFWIGNTPIGGCIACGGCSKAGKCVFGGSVNDFAEKAKDADGFVFGTPVHYAAASGNMTAFHRPPVLFCAEGSVLSQARRRHYLRPPRRHHGRVRAAAQIPRHHGNAHRFLLLLEQCPRLQGRRHPAGRGGRAHHARFGAQYGLAPALYRGRQGRRRSGTPQGAACKNEFYPVKTAQTNATQA